MRRVCEAGQKMWFAKDRPASVPDAPTHAALVAARNAARGAGEATAPRGAAFGTAAVKGA